MRSVGMKNSSSGLRVLDPAPFNGLIDGGSVHYVGKQIESGRQERARLRQDILGPPLGILSYDT